MRIPVKIEIDLDKRAYQREYGDDTETNEEIAAFMRQSVDYMLRDLVKHWSYIRGIEIR